MKCRLDIPCSRCPRRRGCPRKIRRDKHARRPLADSASTELLRRAAAVLSTGWHSSLSLGQALYGTPPPGRTARMNIMVRARRPLNRLKKLGLLAIRPDARGTAEYTLLPEGLEVFG